MISHNKLFYTNSTKLKLEYKVKILGLTHTNAQIQDNKYSKRFIKLHKDKNGFAFFKYKGVKYYIKFTLGLGDIPFIRYKDRLIAALLSSDYNIEYKVANMETYKFMKY